MGGRTISVEEGRAIAAAVLERAGLTSDEAIAVADIVAWTELTGYRQIGLARLPRLAEYVRRVQRTPIRVEREGPFSAHLEAGRALGYVTALRMVEICAEKVRATGVGLVTANGSGLTGRNAYYVERLAEQGWVALMVNNFTPVVAPHGSSEAFGEHRGSALALAIQAFGVVAGSPPAPAQPDEVGIFLMAFDPALFGDPEEIRAHIAQLLERVRHARPADPEVPVRAPNDRALRSMDEIRARGIAVSDELDAALEELA